MGFTFEVGDITPWANRHYVLHIGCVAPDGEDSE
jgi:hypothetical protein